MAKPSRKAVLGILDKMGIEYSSGITLKRAQSKLERELTDEGMDEDVKLTKAELAALKQMGMEMDDEEEEEEEEFEEDEDDEFEDDDLEPSDEDLEEIEEKKTRKKSSKKSSKKAPAKKKKAAKKAPAKKKKASGPKKPGVIASIVEFLKASKRPLNKEQILAKLEKRFPDRKADAMLSTIKVQLPNRLNREKNLKIKKTDKGGFYIK